MPESKEPRVFRLKCARCGGIMICPETVIQTGGACADCGNPINIEAYPPLLKLADELNAARAAEREREQEERRQRQAAERLQREEERARQWEEDHKRLEEEHEQQAKRNAERLAALQRAEHERAQREAAEYERARRATLATALQEATAVTPSLPKYGALLAVSWMLRCEGIAATVIAGVVLLVAVGLLASGLILVGAYALFAAVCIVSAAILSLGLSQLLGAIRDMAVSSWKQTVLLQGIRQRMADAHTPGLPPARE